MKLSIQTFTGEKPGIKNPQSLLITDASRAINVKVDAGDLRPWRVPEVTANIDIGVDVELKTVYYYDSTWIGFRNDVDLAVSPIENDTYERVYFTGAALFAYNTTTGLWEIVTGGGADIAPKFFALDMVPTGASFSQYRDWLYLGIPAPAAAIGSATPGVADVTTVSYIYTFINSYGDESVPADPKTITNWDGASNVTLGGFTAPEENRGIDTIRVYRTSSGENTTDFDFVMDEAGIVDVAEFAAATGYWYGKVVSYNTDDQLYQSIFNPAVVAPDDAVNGFGGSGVDHWAEYTAPDDEVIIFRKDGDMYRVANGAGSKYAPDDAVFGIGGGSVQWEVFEMVDTVAEADLGEPCPSETYYPPSDTDGELAGLILLSNGSMAAFIGNTVFMTELFKPHAWNPDYATPLSSNVVSIGQFGTTTVVSTEGFPYLLFGRTPSVIEKKRLGGNHPCLSKRGTVSFKHGVIYPDKEGFVVVNQNGVNALLKGVQTVDSWKNFNPTSIHGYVYNSRYYGFYTIGDGAQGFVFDILNPIPTFTEFDFRVYAGIVRDDGDFYIVTDAAIESLIIDEGGTPTYTSDYVVRQWEEGSLYEHFYYKWYKEFLLSKPINFAVGRVVIDEDFLQEAQDYLEANDILAGLNAAILASGELEGATCESATCEHSTAGDLLYDVNSSNISSTVLFELYADGVLKVSKQVGGDDLFKLPAGFKSKRYEVRLQGNIPLRRLDLATSAMELAR